ncbi:MAG: SOS response-associated peptidase [Rhodospirillales bacterium]
MCSRFELNVTSSEVGRRLELDLPPDLWSPTDELRPTDDIPVIDAFGRVQFRRWGPPAPWDAKPMINARAETLTEKPTFKPFKIQRFLVPASAYFEWRKSGRSRLKNRIYLSDSPVTTFAAIGNDDAVIILTTAPAPDIAHIHNRMPAVLADREKRSHWLSAPEPLAVRHLLPLQGLSADEEVPQNYQGDLFA